MEGYPNITWLADRHGLDTQPGSETTLMDIIEAICRETREIVKREAS